MISTNYFVFSFAADICSLVIIIIGLVLTRFWGDMIGKMGKITVCALLIQMVEVLSNMAGLYWKGSTQPYAHTILLVSNFLEFAFNYMLSFCTASYLIIYIERRCEVSSRMKKVVTGWLVISLMALALSQIWGIYYTVDIENYYHRETGYPISLIFGFGGILLYGIILFQFRKQLEKEEWRVFSIYIVLSLIGVFVQQFIYGIYIVLLINTVSVSVMFLMIYIMQIKKYFEKEKQIKEMQVQLMLSQIQPHFIFNSLAVIEQLCITDPELTKEALDYFSVYLRHNLDALKKNGTVPFEEELNHVKAYLFLEKLRFGDLLEIQYNIETTGFCIPSLTIQPIVENAVKHGVFPKIEGGSIYIETKEEPKEFQVIIKDDGVGFHYSEKQKRNDKETHVGIENVRYRLHSVGAHMQIESTEGKGTTVTISIPKEEMSD